MLTKSAKVKNLSSVVSTAIEHFSNHDTRLLSSIRQLILSGLKSRHRSIVNQFIVMWNQTFGRATTLEYPEGLCGTLFRLQCTTDIQLPSFSAVVGDEVCVTKAIMKDDAGTNDLQAMSSSPIRFLESQEDQNQLEDVSSAKAQRKDAIESSLLPLFNDQRAVVPILSPKVAAAKLPLSARRRVETTPKARLRHADSQITFAAIESSPLAPEAIGSQDLTDRQKEVRERQGHEAAMFPEIRSSPKSASRSAEYNLPKLVFKPDRGQSSKPAVDQQTSPVYPPDMLMNDYLGSSPTPASSKKGTNGNGSLNGSALAPQIVAYPHKVIGQTTMPMSLDLENETMGVTIDFATSQLMEYKDTSNSKRNEEIGENGNILTKIVPNVKHPNGDTVPAVAIPEPEDRVMSDLDVFVDAPSEPTETHPPPLQDIDTSRADEPSLVSGRSNVTNDDDQVAAQLISEMERASSQRSNKEDRAVKLASRDTSKRKGSFDDDHIVRKRKRGMPTSSLSAQQPQASTAGQDVAECVMIDVRPAKVQLQECLVQVKREKSPSPSIMGNIRPARRSLLAKKGRERPLRRPPLSQSGGKPSSSLSSPGQDQGTPESHVDDASAMNDIRMRLRKSARLNDAMSSSPARSTTSAPEVTISEPGSLTNSGKRKASKFWYYVSEGSEDETGTKRKEGVSDEDGAKVTAEDDGSAKSATPAQQQPLSGPQCTTGTREAQHLCGPDGTKEQEKETSRVEAAAEAGLLENAPTAEGIVQGFRKMLSNIKRVALGREDEREISKLLFQSMEELHEAGRRHTAL